MRSPRSTAASRPTSVGRATITSADGSRRAVETVPGAYEAFYRGMVRAIAEGAEGPVKPEDAVNVVRDIELALRSHRERRTVQQHAAGSRAGVTRVVDE